MTAVHTGLYTSHTTGDTDLRNRDVNDPSAGAGAESRAGSGVVHVSVPFLHYRNRAPGAAKTAAPTPSRGSRPDLQRLLRVVRLDQAAPVAVRLLASAEQ